MAIQGAEAAYVMLLFSVAFFCARFLLDRLVYKVWPPVPLPHQIRAGFREISLLLSFPARNALRRSAGAGWYPPLPGYAS
jgi:hypothetical protein